jgi:transcriptional regulator GlxA family with amidase domain
MEDRTSATPADPSTATGQARRVAIVLFEGVQSLDVTGPMEVFVGATQAVRHLGSIETDGEQANDRAHAGYELVLATDDGTPVRSSSGLLLTPDVALTDLVPDDTLVVPGGSGTRQGSPAVVTWLREHAGAWRRVVSVCTGAFLLAEAGVLAGRRVTTHWAFAASLAARYPDVTVDPDPIYVRDGNVATSAGVTAGVDLALALVEEDHGRDVALTVARYLVVFLRRPGNQHQFSAQLQAQTATQPGLREVQRHVAEHPDDDLSVARLARLAGMSPRHFARRFRHETGVPPGRYVDQVRLEAARRLLEDTDHGVERVASHCGYGTSESMRRAFLRQLGVTPAEYRRRLTAANNTSTTGRSTRR